MSDSLILTLCFAISKTKKISKAANLLADLLTPAELRMISKRLAVASMLIKGHSYQEIKELLHVGYSTVARISTWLQDSGDGFIEAHETCKSFDPTITTLKKWDEMDNYEKLVRKHPISHLFESTALKKREAAARQKIQALKKINRSKSSKIRLTRLQKIISQENISS